MKKSRTAGRNRPRGFPPEAACRLKNWTTVKQQGNVGPSPRVAAFEQGSVGMLQIPRAWMLSLLLVVSVCGWVEAQGPGFDDLNQATVLKLTAQSPSDWAKVIDLCESALAKGLDDGNKKFAEQLLASTLIRRGVFVGEQLFAGALTTPQWPQYRLVALRDLERALQLDPSQVDALIMVARLNLLPGGDAKRGRAALDKAVELSKDDPISMARALVFKAMVADGDAREARNALEEHVARGKDDPSSEKRLSALKATIEEKDREKLALLDEAIQANPDSAEALRMRGAVYADSNQLEKAEADLRKAVELDEKHPIGLLSLGMVLMQEAMNPDAADNKLEERRKTILDEALELFKKTAELGPELRGLGSDGANIYR